MLEFLLRWLTASVLWIFGAIIAATVSAIFGLGAIGCFFTFADFGSIYTWLGFPVFGLMTALIWNVM